MKSIRTKALLWSAAGLGTLLAVRAVARQRRAIRLQGKVVLVTGGSRGLGLVLCRQLAGQGVHGWPSARASPTSWNGRAPSSPRWVRRSWPYRAT